MPLKTVGTGRALMGARGALWTPALPTTDGGYLPEHWYRSDSGLWQDAGITPAAADGDVVGRWEDLTANADHVNQAVVASKPTLQNGVGDLLNGYPVIRADGIDDNLFSAFTTGGAMAQPNTVFAVAALNIAAVNDGLPHHLFFGNWATLYAWDGPVPDAWRFFAGAGIVGTATDSNWNIWTGLFNGAAGQYWKNGINEGGPANVGANALTQLYLFSQLGAASPWHGDITEIVLYDANLSDADKNQVGAYLATRYGLAYTDI